MGFRFLVVDDSSIIRKVVIKVLGMTTIDTEEVFEASNGQEALDIIKDNWVDLVLLDINMPVMNGIEFLSTIRCDVELKDTKVVIISTEGSKSRLDELEKLKIDAYLRKPVTPEKIMEMIGNVLGVSV